MLRPPETKIRPPLSLGVLNCGGLPIPARKATRPEPLARPSSSPPSRSTAHTRPPATMGGPPAAPVDRRPGRGPDGALAVGGDLEVGLSAAGPGGRYGHHPAVVVAAVALQPPVGDVHAPVGQAQRTALLVDAGVRRRVDRAPPANPPRVEVECGQ